MTVDGFEAYQRAREAVLRMKGLDAASAQTSDPSRYWAEELENIDYLIEASPLIVRKLRHHAFHVTGIRPFDYRTKDDARRELFTARWQALRDLGGDALFVPESPALGGFGYALGGRLANVDTLKFFEVLVGMERGGVLAALRRAERPVVCEIGAGWGGFAYQFKTLFPRATYVIVDFPELFLFSATYLATVFPEASVRFVDHAGAGALDGWRDDDFVFVPHTLAHLVTGLPLDLTVNMVSFQEMTAEQVRRYTELAAGAGCPLLYSLNRERSPYNTELASVSELLAERYRLTEVPVLDTDYTSAMKKPPKAGKGGARAELRYRHLVGRLASADARVTGAEGGLAHQRSGRAGSPTVVLGMTLHNRAGFLPEALDSLLNQTYQRFAVVMLDDASTDGTEEIARAYAGRDLRVSYHRHATRAGMIATWREVVDLAVREHPDAQYFAWASDHDRWHPRWLETLVGALEADSGIVLAYPITRRMDGAGLEHDKGARLFDTAAQTALVDRWMYFCRHAVGSGDMVYGLMRIGALRAAGTFRTVLRPDRLLIAELTLQGRIRQVPEVLWFRREAGAPSIQRQRETLLPPGNVPPWFGWPPSVQHLRVLRGEYARTSPPAFGLSRTTWMRMLIAYQRFYGWRHFRKSETFHSLNRGIDRVIWVRKVAMHHVRHGVYDTLMALRTARGKARRLGRRALYHVLVLTHRTGLRGRNETPLR